jgi:hypothetical protein
MARNETITIPAATWTQLTNANAAAARVQNRSGYSVLLSATPNATAPTTTAGAVELLPGQILAADLTFAQLWPGVTAPVRLWAYCDLSATLSASHADA